MIAGIKFHTSNDEVGANGLPKTCPGISCAGRTVVTGDDETGASVQGRRILCIFERDMYLIWTPCENCGTDDDPYGNDTCPSALQQSFSSPSAGAEG